MNNPMNHTAGARIIGVAASAHPHRENEQILAVHYELDGSEHVLLLEHPQAIALLIGVDQLIQRLGRSNLASALGPTIAGLKRPPGRKTQ